MTWETSSQRHSRQHHLEDFLRPLLTLNRRQTLTRIQWSGNSADGRRRASRHPAVLSDTMFSRSSTRQPYLARMSRTSPVESGPQDR